MKIQKTLKIDGQSTRCWCLGLIRNTIEPSLRSTISQVEVAKDLWNDIKERFSVTNGPRIQQLKSDLVNCKQKGKTIVDYYGKLKQIWDELDNFDQSPTCKCRKCECKLEIAFEKKREEEKVHSFLMELDVTMYGTVRSNILAQDPLPNLNKVYSTLIQEERVKTIARERDERGDVMALAIRARGNGKDKTMVCSHYKQTGHKHENCFALIGYPEWWGDRPRSDAKDGGRGRAQPSQGGRGGGRGGRVVNRVNATQAGVKMLTGVESSVTPPPGLSPKQWQTLLHVLGWSQHATTEKMTGKDLLGILDTGATNHMAGMLGVLRDLKEIAPCPVGLPNGTDTICLLYTSPSPRD